MKVHWRRMVCDAASQAGRPRLIPDADSAAALPQQWRDHALQLYDHAHFLAVGQRSKSLPACGLGAKQPHDFWIY